MRFRRGDRRGARALRIARRAMFALAGAAIVGGPAVVLADDFYRGKTLRILVGTSAGGGHDTEARLLARHLGRHVPGTPRVVVENLAGAGGLIAANTVARTVTPDGLTIAFIPTAVVAAQLLGSAGVRYDLRQFQMLGAAYADRRVCLFPAGRGIATLDDWKAARRPLRLGATGADSVTALFPTVLARILDLPAQVVTGYRGTAEIRFAIAAGELDGTCTSVGGARAGWPGLRDISVVVQGGVTPSSQLREVPLAIEYANTPEARELLGTFFEAFDALGRIYALPPGTPSSRRDTLRVALMETFRDPAYIEDGAAMGVTNDPMSGDEVDAHVRSLFSVTPESIARLKDALAR